jgi:4-hydroxymandelate oxidase
MSAAAPLVTLDDYERAAAGTLPAAAWEYIASGAADEYTLRANREAFARILLDPRVLNDVRSLDLSVRVLGHRLPHPILLAPVASNGIVHPEGEVAAASGARAAGAGMVLSSYTSRRVEEVAATGVTPLWFQLYMQEREATRDLIGRVVAAGCSAIVLTVDTPTPGARDRQTRSGFDHPAGLPYRTVKPGDNPCTWDDIAWVREHAKVPVLLKGIMHPEDAELAVQAGAAGIVVSNHGGRNLDTAPATIDVLPRIARRLGAGRVPEGRRIPVLLDGGVRRGTDALKALALGADAVLIGRPYVYGLAVAGADGVRAVVDILRHELELAMALVGRASLTSLDASIIFGERDS